MAEEQAKEQTQINNEEITSEYANNTYFVRNIWDLKILFGELGIVGQGVDWHTAVTLPWAQAKLMSFYLQVNIAVHEATHGKVKVPTGMLPPPAPSALGDAEVLAFINKL